MLSPWGDLGAWARCGGVRVAACARSRTRVPVGAGAAAGVRAQRALQGLVVVCGRPPCTPQTSLRSLLKGPRKQWPWGSPLAVVCDPPRNARRARCPPCRRAQQRWRRCRKFACLLAEDAETGEVVGCCTVK